MNKTKYSIEMPNYLILYAYYYKVDGCSELAFHIQARLLYMAGRGTMIFKIMI